jgi:hypothetical protein
VGRKTQNSWLASPAFDLGFFVLPGLLSALVAVLWVAATGPSDEDSLALWIGGVLLVDVAHVYASLYRTYFDAEARALHGARLWLIPALVAWFGFLLHLESARLFWGCLAYIAVFHFIKQHLGFALLYVKAGAETREEDRWVRRTIWVVTLAPVIAWHARLPRQFAWFTPTDFITGLPEAVGTIALWCQLPVLLVFCARRWRLAARRKPNLMVPLLVLTPALTWNLGIVWFDDDRVFTMTNIFLHGIPYFALVWLAGGQERSASMLPGQKKRPVVVVAAFFYILLALLAVTEEGLWDQLMWHEHAVIFGDWGLRLEGWPVALAAALLTVPQATHYILDRFIWRPGPDNPRLAAQLGFPETQTETRTREASES